MEVVYVTEARVTVSGISRPLLDSIQGVVSAAIVIGGASPTFGLGTWHMNDAEQQALKIAADHIRTSPNMTGAIIKAVKANRKICAACAHTLVTDYSMNVNDSEARV